MLNRDKTEAIVISAVNTRAHATVGVVVDVCVWLHCDPGTLRP